jgi:tyrosinase
MLILLFILFVNSQITPTIDDLTTISVTPYLFCHLTTTSTILGYSGRDGTPVYKNSCAGFCLSTIAAPYECRQITKYIQVNAYPYSYGITSNIVKQVVSCECKPKRCMLSYNQYYIYIEHGQYTTDNCDRRCLCSYGQLINCCRQRKNFVDMSYIERTRFINTFKIMTTTLPWKPLYEAMVNAHQTLFFSGIHGTPIFLPWHRNHLLQIENLLQQIDCRVTIPYWDWAAQAASPFSGAPWLNTNDWLGDVGNGTCVTGGPFNAGIWLMPNGNCLSRNFISGSIATLADIQLLFNANPNPTASNYDGIRAGLEAGPGMHNTVHCAIGGNMCTTYAASSPEFNLHHCNIDRLWADWQSLSINHVTTYSANPSLAMLGTTVTPNDVFDLNNQYGGIKVCYIRSQRWVWLTDILATFNIDQLMSIPKTPVILSQREWPGVQANNFTKIRIDELARNRGNIINSNDTSVMARVLGLSINLTNYVGMYDINGCFNNQYVDINDRCDTINDTVNTNGNTAATP